MSKTYYKVVKGLHSYCGRGSNDPLNVQYQIGRFVEPKIKGSDLLLGFEIMPSHCQVLRELVPVLSVQRPLNIGHQLIQAACDSWSTISRLILDKLLSNLTIHRLCDKDQSKHWPGQ